MSDPKRTIVYIDGFNLYFGIVEKGWRRYLWLDVRGFAASLMGANETLEGVKYFTSRVTGPPDKQARQSAIIDANSLSPEVGFYYGNFKQRAESCSRCGVAYICPQCARTYVKSQEKGTDVNIATQLVADAFLDRFDAAVIVTADMDLLPAIECVRQHHPMKSVTVAFPPKRVTAGLKAAARRHMFVGESHLAQNQLPDPVVQPNGHQIRKPATWV